MAVLEFAVDAFELGFVPSPPGRANEAPPPSPDEERRLRRMISNRESARRSRMRRQRRLEGLRLEAERLETQNRGLSERLEAMSYYSTLLRRDNGRLRFESAVLRRRLAEASRIYDYLLRGRVTWIPRPPPAPLSSMAAAGNDPMLASLTAGSFFISN
ncbi:basic leucine zipper 4-like [Curcuma longa]|uniref:basic leucine zipper 4-like n=1 Tax=Curcuma longa TaxID=136217 RepID=UPI003D9EFED9